MKINGVTLAMTTMVLIAIEIALLSGVLAVCVIVIRDPTLSADLVAVGMLSPPILAIGVLLLRCTDEKWVQQRFWILTFLRALSFAGIGLGCAVFGLIAVGAVWTQLSQLLKN